MTPTSEQAAILAAASDSSRPNLMIRAYAGCGKTSTLRLIAEQAITEPTLYVVFNRRNREEAEGKFPPHVQVRTSNGLGHAAWGRALGKRLIVDDKKLGRIIRARLASIPADARDPDLWGIIKGLVESAMQAGLVPAVAGMPMSGLTPDTPDSWRSLGEETLDDTAIGLARECLISSIAEGRSGLISFDDQLYLSALFGGQFPRFPTVFADELQDQSALQHKMIARCAADRIVAVGDELQAIYAWRGADAQSMANFRKLRPAWVDLPLATTFRCPQATVRRAASHAKGFRAHDGNAEGEVIRFPGGLPRPDPQTAGATSWSWPDVLSRAQSGPISVLCRNNAPLVSLAFKLIRAGIGCSVASRDIGKGLSALAKKLGTDASVIAAWRERETTLALANDDASKAEGISDRAECLLAVLADIPCTGHKDDAPTIAEIERKITALFAPSNVRVTLSSIHRAKGLEFPTVLLLDPWRIPSRFAKSPAALAQEANLRYVAETRTQHTLILANLEDFA